MQENHYQRTPQLLSTFAAELDLAVTTAYDTGSLLIEFNSSKEAMSKKFEFYRFFRAVNFYKPDSELAEVVNSIKIRYDANKLELVRRSGESSNDAIRKAVEGKKAGEDKHLDEVAATLERLNDEPLINPDGE